MPTVLLRSSRSFHRAPRHSDSHRYLRSVAAIPSASPRRFAPAVMAGLLIFAVVAGLATPARADGITWTARTAAEASGWTSVAYGNGLWVAVADSGTNRVMTSPDGITWTARAVPEATNGWYSVAYGKGLWVAVAYDGTNQVMTSPNGITWTARAAAEVGNWYSVAYGNGLWVAVAAYSGTNRVMTSTDPACTPVAPATSCWTAQAAAEANDWQSVAYGNDLWVAVAESGTNRVMTSPDGITWTARAVPVPEATNPWYSVAYGDGLWVAVTGSGTNRVLTSPDGITWTARAAAEPNGWFSVAFGNGLWVAGAYDTNRVMTSPDGINWTARPAVEAIAWDSVAYGNGLWVAVTFGGTNRVMTSGATFTQTPPSTPSPPSVSCAPLPLVPGASVTCTITGGDPGIDIFWQAAYNPVFAGAGVTLDANGTGIFTFTVPRAAIGQTVTVELVEWLAPVSIGVAGGPVPSSVPSGGGPVPVWSLVLLALAGGLALRRMSAAGVRG